MAETVENIESVMRGFENAIARGDFMESCSYFMSLIGSGSQFEFKINSLNQNDNQIEDEDNQQPKKYTGNEQLNYNIKNQNYGNQILERLNNPPQNQQQNNRNNANQLNQQLDKIQLDPQQQNINVQNNYNSPNQYNQQGNQVNQRTSPSQNNSGKQQFPQQQQLILNNQSFSSQEMAFIFQNLNVNMQNQDPYQNPQLLDQLYINYLSQQQKIL